LTNLNLFVFIFRLFRIQKYIFILLDIVQSLKVTYNYLVQVHLYNFYFILIIFYHQTLFFVVQLIFDLELNNIISI